MNANLKALLNIPECYGINRTVCRLTIPDIGWIHQGHEWGIQVAVKPARAKNRFMWFDGASPESAAYNALTYFGYRYDNGQGRWHKA